ncbi:MAG TPA: DEAD/DEAH box helicase [Acidobacteriota bacterium]
MTISEPEAVLDLFHPAVAAWFRSRFDAPTEAQAGGWPSIRAGQHTLIAAPTGSGKTLAAFLAAIDDLVVEGLDGALADETQVVYVSPLKALSNDIHKNLESPLAGIQRQLLEMGRPPVEIRAMVRTGDTPAHERARMVRTPPHILVTTPESLYLLLTSAGGRNMLKTAHTVIVDEIHAVAGDKRGSHLALSLARLDDLAGRPLTRIGLSATQRPIEKVARFLVGTGEAGASARRETAGSAADTGRRPGASHGGAVASAPGEGTLGTSEDATRDCTIIDSGHRRAIDLAIELPGAPLEAIMSNEVWAEVYGRLAALIEEHRTTLVFVNTRRLAERTAHQLSDLIGDDNVAAHHGSLSREQRLDSEQRLKAGSLKAMVATASLELGIDIGDIDLVCQVGSTRSISTLLQRVGRSGHSLRGTPKGRLFPLSRDELVECVALVDAVRRGELDTLIVPQKPLDILAQQIVAEVGAGERGEQELFELMRRAGAYSGLTREEFDEVVGMLADGFSTRRGRRGAHIHHDQVNRRLRPRRGARLAALTSGGAIPEVADFRVVLEPANTFVGTLDQDFAIESLPGDIFQLGNQSYRILRIEPQGVLRVEDASGLPPTIPFWFGEAPGRSAELSAAVSRLRAQVGERLGAAAGSGLADSRVNGKGAEPAAKLEEGAATRREEAEGSATDPVAARTPASAAADSAVADEPTMTAVAVRLADEVGVSRAAAEQVVEYLAAGAAALGGMPTQESLVVERFFDDAGDMHVVVHSPFGSRLNRAWGLALRKRFCRSFNFELQAAATEDAIVLSLGPTHSFPLDEVFKFLHSSSVREVLIQAFLDAPMFPTRWRWNATRALAVLRWRGGKRVPPHLQQMDAEDLIAVVFPDQLACLENIAGDREIPDHPLINQTIRDCLEEAMDIDALEGLLRRIEADEVSVRARDLREPSPLSHEAISARPYAFLDPAPAEERRTLAIRTSRWMDPRTAADLGSLDAAAIARVRQEAWPQVRDADELHDALVLHGFLTEAEGRRGDLEWDAAEGVATGADGEAAVGEGAADEPVDGAGDPSDRGAGPEATAAGGGVEGGWTAHFDELLRQGRATRLFPAGEQRPDADVFWVAAERLPELQALCPDATCVPALAVPARLARRDWDRDEAAVEVLRGRLEGLGPVTANELAATTPLPTPDVDRALLALEGEGFVLRGHFSPAPETPLEWCERRLLARIHRYTINRLRAEIEPVGSRDFMSFLLAWQRVAGGDAASGPESLAGLIDQLEGFPAPAAAWESEILPARLADYDPVWLDALCLAGRLAWGRMPPPAAKASAEGGGVGRRGGPIRATPTALLARESLEVWQAFATPPAPGALELTGPAQAALDALAERGASFFHELATATGLLDSQLEDALGELVAWGLVTADSFTGMRALLVPSSKRPPKRGGRRKGPVAIFGVENAGRWSLLWPPSAAANGAAAPNHWDAVERIAVVLLRRYGVVFRRLMEREGKLPPWRDLLRVYRRLEARGEIRGGRFVAGFSGEQFALPEAIPMLRKARRGAAGGMVSISAADPLNLVGIVTPGERIPALAGNRVLFEGGMPIAALVAGEARYLVEMDAGAQWEAKNRLVRRVVPPQLRAYLGRSA